MNRPSSRLSHRYTNRPQTGMSLRPMSSVGCHHYDPEVIYEEEAHPRRPATSFHYCPEELDQPELLADNDYSYNDPLVCQEWTHPKDPEDPEDPDPLKLGKTYGYGFRKPDKEVSPHWSQWPQPPESYKPHRPAQRHPVFAPTPPPAYFDKTHSYSQQAACDSTPQVPCKIATLTSRKMSYNDRHFLMQRGLSPRRAAPPAMPGRSLTHYGSFGNHEEPSRNIGSLDLYTSPYNFNRGHSTRPSRPIHRHLTNAKPDEGYMHNHSIYYSTTPNVSGYFIIHPDWVSERLSMRRSRSLMSF